jgi:hypothetical protein
MERERLYEGWNLTSHGRKKSRNAFLSDIHIYAIIVAVVLALGWMADRAIQISAEEAVSKLDRHISPEQRAAVYHQGPRMMEEIKP